MQHFSDMLGLKHIHVPHLRGRTRIGEGTKEAVRDKKNESGDTFKTKREPSRLKKSSHLIKSERAATVVESRRTKSIER